MTQFAILRRWRKEDFGCRVFCIVALIGTVPVFFYAHASLREYAAGKRISLPSIAVRGSARRITCNASGVMPRILFWTDFPQRAMLNPAGVDELQVPHCKHRCRVTYNRNYLNCSDALVFHSQDLNINDLPIVRHIFQKWVFYANEAPEYSYTGDFYRLNSLFNWTMTYRSDSDVPLRCGAFRRSSANRNRTNFKDLWMRKKKTAVWLPSACKTKSKREDFVSELQKYTDVDVYGDCGLWKAVSSTKGASFRYFSKDYYFWLALENSLCQDYVTSELFTALKHYIVPVALGTVNYSAITPPHSVIDVFSFASPKLLADYLQKVKMDLNLYGAYFRWKKTYDVVVEDEPFCSLCGKLHSAKFKTFSLYEDLRTWWVNRSECVDWNGSADFSP
ncbi:alpha-(1,3)-fucosyltransferase C-like [Ornithodoros turicata]|uniref:alpha-(1,3)-fucosyltransferase C-like n=1 Tax=Ornithodoros turicata TaxID=34597 RepID=UPI0031387C6D